jgi:uncharacterized membrane protein/glutaredoxin
MKTVRLYSKKDCHLCEDAKMILDAVAARVPFEVQVIDIEKDPVLRQLFSEHVPVVDFGHGTRLYWPFVPDDVLKALNGTVGLAGEALSPAVSGRTRDLVVFVDKLLYHLAKHWVLFIGFFIGLYAGLPFLAPVLMASGYTAPANLIYSAYQFACHQLPSRSYFIFGHQVAFCQRDTAIYVTLFVATFLFAFVRHRIKPLPWQGYVAFIAPMAIDGITQLFGLRSSNWQLRTITGALFGLGSAWLALPYLEEAFQDVRGSVNDKLHLE